MQGCPATHREEQSEVGKNEDEHRVGQDWIILVQLPYRRGAENAHDEQSAYANLQAWCETSQRRHYVSSEPPLAVARPERRQQLEGFYLTWMARRNHDC